MATGYLVTLGADGQLGIGDAISASFSTFTEDGTAIATGSWVWSGVWSGNGQTYNNIPDTGSYYLGTDGNTYFIPDNFYPSSGTASVTAANDGTIEGTAGDDTIDAGYSGDPGGENTSGADDYVVAGAGNDTVAAGHGDDSIEGGSGNDSISGETGDDSIDGGTGDDTISGDTSTGTGRAVFQWSGLDDPDGPTEGTVDDGDAMTTTVSQDTGGTTVTYSYDANPTGFTDGSGGSDTTPTYTNIENYVSGIDSGGATVDPNSSLWIGGDLASSMAELDFADPVSNVSFRVNDIDSNGVFTDRVTIRAYDAFGNPITVNLTAGAGLTLANTDGVAGNDQATSTGAAFDADDADASILVNIPGPVSKIEIIYTDTESTGDDGLVNVTDVYFDEIDDPVGNDTISGGDGNDTIFGDAGNDVLDGDADNDVLYGGEGVDTLDGGTGTDTLFGGAGADSIAGGAGDDTLEGDNGADSLVGGTGDDTLRGEQGTDTLFGGADNDVLDGGDQDDTLFGGAGDDVLDGGEEQSFGDDDTLFGGDGNDTLTETETDTNSNDELHGDAGNDTLSSNTGLDTLYGGADEDTLIMTDTSGGDVIEGGEAGSDYDVLDASTVTSDMNVVYTGNEAGTASRSGETATYSEIEETRTGSGDDTIDASATTAGTTVAAGDGDDSITGGSGDDSIAAGQGADTIEGGAGNDQIDLGNGAPDGDDDLLVFSDGDGSDTVTNFDAPTPNGDGTFTGIDMLDVSALNDAGGQPVNTHDVTVTDDGSGNAVLTFPNNESITLIGISPSDADNPYYLNAIGIPLPDGTVSGTAGGDLIDGSYLDDPDGDRVDADDAIIPGDAANDDLIEAGAGNDTVFGGQGDDEIYGGDDNDTLDGGDGNDTLYGGGGDDTLLAGFGSDSFDGGAGTDTLQIGGSSVDGFAFDIDLVSGTDQYGNTYTDIENIIGGSNNDDLTGNSADNTLEGGSGNDTLTGGDGADTLLGGDDADTINGGGGDTVDGGEGGDDNDTLNVTDVNRIEYDAANAENGTVYFADGTTLDFSNIENVVVTDRDGTVSGTVGDDLIDSAYVGDPDGDLVDSDDAILPGDTGNDDLIEAGAGNDTIFAADGEDSISAGSGNDTVFGGDGNDSISGDGGQDTLDGGAGNDQITGYGTLMGSDGDDFLVDMGGIGSDDTLDGGAGNDVLLAAEGNDHLYGGTDNDMMEGGGGDDTFYLLEDYDTDLITGGEFDEVNGDTIDASALTSDQILTYTGDEAGSIAGAANTGDPDEDDTATFSEIERVVLGSGNDTIDTSTFDVTVDAGQGDDTFIVNDGFGTSTLNAGEGGLTTGDLIDGSGLTSNVTVDFSADEDGTISDGTNTATFTDVERINTGSGDDTITGSSGGESIDAGAGNDTIAGGGGNDDLSAGDGDDTIDGGTGADTIDAGAGEDVISLTGNFGDDTIVGGEGGETNGDILDGSTLTNDVTVTFGGAEAGDFDMGGNNADFSEIEQVITGSGDDTITGGAGADTVVSGAGDDTFTFSDGDSMSGGSGSDIFTLTDQGGATTINIDGGSGDEGGGGDTLVLGDLADIEDVLASAVDDGTGSFSGSITLDDGTILNYSEIENIICFTPGTRIATPQGARDIADLRVGDLVVTRDHGLQPIRWIQSRTVPAIDRFAPVRIRPGVVTGQETDLLVSPQHRMLFQDYRAELLFGESEVLVAAKHLVDGTAVTQDAGGEVTYIHMMFDEHEIVFAEGAATESFHPGDVGLSAVHDAARDELFTLFPDIRADVNHYGPTARKCLKRHEAELLRV